ncbi:MAG: hypothetical protein AAF683_03690 [Pseudomonadota bacterium]
MGNGTRIEMFIAICALISSAVAVFIAWDQGRVMRAQQHADVLPVLQIDGILSNESYGSELGLRITNTGVGPARIYSANLMIDGTPVESLAPVFESLPFTRNVSWRNVAGRSLAPGSVVTPLSLKWKPEEIDQGELLAFGQTTDTWTLQICYCSVFDRCWQTERLGSSFADVVDDCELSEPDIFTELGLQSPIIDAYRNEQAASAEQGEPE